ncbi:AP2-like ethylene-responsive transcription factor [Iris pallida]|uniref:AP2-like ethylene-responsive transcription factor n=1 Tax=Iris pallida TaxID=29817 RepID=A0AAX6HGG0_IRIPA|nr:AP2-like ethylene-responsive transcription factor [Iris pallida]
MLNLVPIGSGIGGLGDTRPLCGIRIVGMNLKTRKEDNEIISQFSCA